MTAETLANDNLSTPANDELHQLHTVNGSGTSATLRDSVDVGLKNYCAELGGAAASAAYQLVLSAVEAPPLEQVTKASRNNHTKPSPAPGRSRGTLRKKHKQYGLL